MNEVKKCSISGVAFTLDIDAYESLHSYLESLKKSYAESSDGEEIIADIEARIAELILSAQDNHRVVERPLILNIIQQLGSAEDITDGVFEENENRKAGSPRIPRRLYRDTENAKLGGVCSGIGKYFDIDPVWVRLALFLPLVISGFGCFHVIYWVGPMMGNLFGIFMVCYLIMWFVVPPARTARQKLEMNGEPITVQSIREGSTARPNEPDAKAKPIVAEAVSVFGKVLVIALKILAGFMVGGLLIAACVLLIGIIAVLITGSIDGLLPDHFSLWIPVLGICIGLIPIMLSIYVLMCLIASRKPSVKTIVIVFLLWLLSIISCCTIAIKEGVDEEVLDRHGERIEKFFEEELGEEVKAEMDTTSTTITIEVE